MGYSENSELNYDFPFNRILATYILRFIKLYNSNKECRYYYYYKNKGGINND